MSKSVESELFFEGLHLHISRKPIKRIYLTISLTDGKIKISAPIHCRDEIILCFVQQNKEKIYKAVEKAQSRLFPKINYLEGEKIPLFGENIVLRVIEEPLKKPLVVLKEDAISLKIWYNSTFEEREKAIFEFYKANLNRLVLPLIEEWENIWGVKISGYTFRRQKTRWGSCNRRSRRISLNIELAKYPQRCIEYIVAHELLHINIPGHGADFKEALTARLPDWRLLNSRLKEAPAI